MSAPNAQVLMRSLIVYAICIPLAIFIGFTLTDLNSSSLLVLAVFVSLLSLPIVLKYHYPLLLFSWNCAISLFFIKTSPNLWLVMVLISLTISVVERVLSRESTYLSVPSVAIPLLFFLGLIFITAQLSGGFGFHAMGSAVYGGKKYIILVVGVLSYFALVTRPIPEEKARFYISLFILGQLTKAISDFYSVAPGWLTPLFYVFPPTSLLDTQFELGVTRLAGVGAAGSALFCWMIAQYGLRGIILTGKVWRPFLLALFFVLGTMGGFRSSLFLMLALLIFAFFAEKLYQTWVIAPAVLGSIFLALLIIPVAHHLPFTVQRAMAFLPLDLDREAVAAAQSSTDWRFNMWSGLMQHEVPDHLWKGKGYAFAKEDYDEMMGNTAFASSGFASTDVDQQGLALAGDYHNGVLSLVITFGVWGVAIFLWFMIAGLRVVYLNFRYGRPELKTINFFLFMMFFIEFASYVSCVGGLAVSSDIAWFVGYLGFSIALNHGVCHKHSEAQRNQPAPLPAPSVIRPRLPAGVRANA